MPDDRPSTTSDQVPETKHGTRPAITIGRRLRSFNAAFRRSRQERLGKDDTWLRLARDVVESLVHVFLFWPLKAAVWLFFVVWMVAFLFIIALHLFNLFSMLVTMLVTGCAYGQTECMLILPVLSRDTFTAHSSKQYVRQ